MFAIPDFYIDTPDFDNAVRTVKFQGSGNLLAGMEAIQARWDEYASGDMDMIYQDDDDFYDHWQYEVNAYNVVFESMSALLAPKETV